jgi:hypothetical protein
MHQIGTPGPEGFSSSAEMHLNTRYSPIPMEQGAEMHLVTPTPLKSAKQGAEMHHTGVLGAVEHSSSA